MKKAPVRLLNLISDGAFHSGEELASQLGITRTAIWKLINQLKTLGLSIEAVRGKGYRLDRKLDLLSKEKIKNDLTTAAIKQCRGIEVLFSINSTNTYLLDRLDNEQLHSYVVLAEFQSQGRGRRGNKWLSPIASGLYFSIAWRFHNNPGAMSILSLCVGVAIVRALKAINISNTFLKWPNDVLVQHKKLGGVLIDVRGETGEG